MGSKTQISYLTLRDSWGTTLLQARMDTLITAIVSKKPKKVRELIRSGFLINPYAVEALLIQTSEFQGEGIISKRMEVAEALLEVKKRKPVSAEKLLSLPLNHQENPMGVIRVLETKFDELIDAWEVELARV